MAAVWTITKLLAWTKDYFAGKGIENPRLDAELLLGDVLHCERIDLYVRFDQPLQPEELNLYHQYVVRRGRLEPLAYILGHREFYRYDFKVTPAVLIPRPETELLVEKAAEACGAKPVRILDIGTGSGAILLSLLASLPQAEGVGLDLSEAALAVAKDNAAYVAEQAKDPTLTNRVSWVQGNVTQGLPAGSVFDLVVSNPPYIPTGDIAGLAADVQKEPRLALDGGADGLDLYRRLVPAAVQVLRPEGLLAMEIGIHESKPVVDLCVQSGLKATAVRPDYAGIERMVFAAAEGSSYADYLLELKK